ncbi:MAG: UbiA family prenyltransferase [Candidatus Aenigmarchaeota archaeon]|nr:UbiA family prenyltransferase [Candidatus Aenigmarchaeota archaeon]
MHPYLEITRPNVCALAALGLFVGSVVAKVPLGPSLAYALAAAVLICAAGNVINDYFDFHIDKVNAPLRPLPSGRMKRLNALYFSFALFIAGIAVSSYVNSQFFAAAIINSAISFMYASNFKRMPLVSNLVVSWLSVSVYVAAGFVNNEWIGGNIALLATMSFFAMMAREIIKDVEDMAGDRKGGAMKLPSVIGKRASVWLSRIFSIIAVALVPVPYVLGMMGKWYLLPSGAAAMLVIASMFKSPKEAKKGLKTGMFLVLLGYVAGSAVL